MNSDFLFLLFLYLSLFSFWPVPNWYQSHSLAMAPEIRSSDRLGSTDRRFVSLSAMDGYRAFCNTIIHLHLISPTRNSRLRPALWFIIAMMVTPRSHTQFERHAPASHDPNLTKLYPSLQFGDTHRGKHSHLALIFSHLGYLELATAAPSHLDSTYSAASFSIEKMSSSSYPSNSDHHSGDQHTLSGLMQKAIMRLMIRDAIIRLHNNGFSTLALATKVRHSELATLNNRTIFTVEDLSIFSDSRSYTNSVRLHMVPNRYLTLPIGMTQPVAMKPDRHMVFVLMLIVTWLSAKPGNDVVKGMNPFEGNSKTRNPFSRIRKALSSSKKNVMTTSALATAVYFVFLSTVLGALVLSSLILPSVLMPVAATDNRVSVNAHEGHEEARALGVETVHVSYWLLSKKIAETWQASLEERGRIENVKTPDMHTFLQHLVTFHIVKKEDLDLYRKLVSGFAARKQMPKLAVSLGLSGEMANLIRELLSKDQQLDAVHFTYEVGLVDRFPPVPLPRAFLKAARKDATSILEDPNNAGRAVYLAAGKEQSALRDVIKCIEEYKLEDEIHLENQKRFEQLEKVKIEKKKLVAVPANKRMRASNSNGGPMPQSKAGRLTTAFFPRQYAAITPFRLLVVRPCSSSNP